jgi:hypothetical protein
VLELKRVGREQSKVERNQLEYRVRAVDEHFGPSFPSCVPHCSKLVVVAHCGRAAEKGLKHRSRNWHTGSHSRRNSNLDARDVLFAETKLRGTNALQIPGACDSSGKLPAATKTIDDVA